MKCIPVIGNWLAEHVPRWRDDSPKRRAGAAAAARRAKVTSKAEHQPLGLSMPRHVMLLAIAICNFVLQDLASSKTLTASD